MSAARQFANCLAASDAEVRAGHDAARADAIARGDHRKLAVVNLRSRMWSEAIAEAGEPEAQPAPTDRERQLIALKLAAPMRSSAGRAVEHQRDAGHLPLFVTANEPSLL